MYALVVDGVYFTCLKEHKKELDCCAAVQQRPLVVTMRNTHQLRIQVQVCI